MRQPGCFGGDELGTELMVEISLKHGETTPTETNEMVGPCNVSFSSPQADRQIFVIFSEMETNNMFQQRGGYIFGVLTVPAKKMFPTPRAHLSAEHLLNREVKVS